MQLPPTHSVPQPNRASVHRGHQRSSGGVGGGGEEAGPGSQGGGGGGGVHSHTQLGKEWGRHLAEGQGQEAAGHRRYPRGVAQGLGGLIDYNSDASATVVF
mmetsp:Transcript_12327/g.6137  ORF Transcript_12327/g.6137 Transcript_12327/m.6137 type:complete len:101 (+) Transcript_12327:302-604(+)